MHILAISGSLRAGSVNTSLLRAAAKLVPDYVTVTLYDGLDDLPHFSPERDTNEVPQAVHDLRAQLRDVDAVLICAPEYAHGIPGVLKNMLDWIVSSGELIDKPTGLITAATEGNHAHASLTETLTMLSAHIVEGASLIVSFARTKIDAEGRITDRSTALALQVVMDALVNAAQPRHAR